MINLNHEYALLEDGEIKCLWLHFGYGEMEQRECYKDENGDYYLYYDKFIGDERFVSFARERSKIIITSNSLTEIRIYQKMYEMKKKENVATNDEE